MKRRRWPLLFVLLAALAACAAPALPETISDPADTPPVSDVPAGGGEEERPVLPGFAAPNDYLPEALPASCRAAAERHPWDPYTRALLTDGEVLIVPEMRLSQLPEAFRDALACVERDGAFEERYGLDWPEWEGVCCAVYETEDLRIVTVYCAPETERQHAGTEYVWEVQVLSAAFHTSQGIQLGDTAERCGTPEEAEGRTAGTPCLAYRVQEGVLTELAAASSRDLSTLADTAVFFFHPET